MLNHHLLLAPGYMVFLKCLKFQILLGIAYNFFHLIHDQLFYQGFDIHLAIIHEAIYLLELIE